MKRRLLIIVSTDPRSTHRTAEALRIAAGLAAWQKTEITLCLQGPAVNLLHLRNLPNARETERHLSLLTGEGRPILVCAAEATELNDTTVECRAADTQQLASIAAQHDCVLRY